MIPKQVCPFVPGKSHPHVLTLCETHVLLIHSVSLMVSFSFLYLLYSPINHQPFTMVKMV
jgi:hypothetical protein